MKSSSYICRFTVKKRLLFTLTFHFLIMYKYFILPLSEKSGRLSSNSSRGVWVTRLGRQVTGTFTQLFWNVILKYFCLSELAIPKQVNCCVRGCFNNFRNSPDLQYYRIPKDSTLRKEYKRLLCYETLKLRSDNTRICCTLKGKRKIVEPTFPLYLSMV